MMTRKGTKEYDAAYFERWYHDPSSRISDGGDLQRLAAFVVALTEQILGREIRTVLDVGCGEGRWQPALHQLRPAIQYQGLDPSTHAIEKFGRSRNLRYGSLGSLRAAEFDDTFDLVICADVLHYLPAKEIDRGLAEIAELTGGVAYLSLFTAEDEPIGDMAGWHRRSGSWYRERFARAGLLSCGMQCWVGPSMAESLSTLDTLRLEV
jgi:SAM-dependent methyltransferase